MATHTRDRRAAWTVALTCGVLAAAVAVAAATAGAATTSDGGADPNVTDVVLTVGETHAERNIAWYTTTEGAGKVEWARASAKESESFPRAETESADASSSGETHDGRHYSHATMSGLEASTDYVYRVGVEGAWSEPYTFSTGNTATGEFSFVAMGDPQLGSSGNIDADREGWNATLEAAMDGVPEAAFVLSMGDQVQDPGAENQYAALLSPTAVTSVPFAFNLGNHDVGSSAYQTHFFMPGVGDSPGNYAFTYGDVLVVGIDSNTLDASAHDVFIGDVLAEHGADVHWTIVTFHHTAFGVAEHSNEAELVEFRGQIAPVLSSHGVHLVLMGHDHTYARTHLLDGRDPVASDDADSLQPNHGEVLYMTLNSGSGSKYYPILEDQALDAADPDGFDYAHTTAQDQSPTFTQVDVAPDALTIATYRTDSREAIDEFVLHHTDDDPGEDASKDARGGTGDDAAEASPSPSPSDAGSGESPETTEGDEGMPAGAVVALVAGAAALVGGAVWLRQRRLRATMGK